MPQDTLLLDDLVILLLASVPLAFLCNRLRLPVIVGFIITGVVIGPFGAGLIKEVHIVESLAELGVVLLLFTVGLELSMRRIIEMRRLVIRGGLLQVGITLTLFALVVKWGGRPLNQALFIGFLFALSSTAIVLKIYMDRAEVDTPHGRAGLGILLFQDLCIVPMMLLVPILSGTEGTSLRAIGTTVGGALIGIVVIIFTARTVVPFLLYHIVKLRSSEVFIIFIVLVTLGTSWISAKLGLSVALGAFIAGLVLSESEYSHQIVADILPFRDVFNSIFFVSIGMLLSLKFLSMNLPFIMLLVGTLIIGKAIAALIAVRITGHSLRVSTMTALGLAQIGEFSFILASAGAKRNLISGDDFSAFLSASIISMMATPFLIKYAPRIGYSLQALISPDSLFEPSMIGFGTIGYTLTNHVIVVGYGLNGQNLSKVLRRVNISYRILELNADSVRMARSRGEPVQYGDSTRREVLHRAGMEGARIIVLAISDPIATRRTVALAREMNPKVKIIVRTRYMSELHDLYKLGADQIIPEEFETSIEIFSRVLSEYGIRRNVVQREVEEIRREGYQMLSGVSSLPIERQESDHDMNLASTEILFIDDSSPAKGKTLGSLSIRSKTGASVVAVVREGQTHLHPDDGFTISPADILVLLGRPDAIDKAIGFLSSKKSEF